jgi:urease accessory protein
MLMAWLSPAFPVGAYTYSHGLEWAIEDGSVTTPDTLRDWIADILRHGAGRNDAILFRHAWHAVTAGNDADLLAIIALASAFQPSRERHLETTAQGRAFLTTVTATWPNARLAALAEKLEAQSVPYPIAVAIAAACHGVPEAVALPPLLTAFAANLVSVGVRAIPIGQTDGQKIVAALAPLAAEIAAGTTDTPLDDLGGAALRADIASMKHETQYTRLFRS